METRVRTTKPTHAIEFGESKINVVDLKSAKAKTDVKMLAANDVPEPETKKEEVKPKVTKKSVVIELISTKKGATVDQIAQQIVERGIDPDLEKNKRVVKLWLSKIGFHVEKLADSGYYRKA